MDLGPHATFIIAAYSAVVVVLAVLISWLTWDGLHQRRMLDELEARGTRRRSSRRIQHEEPRS